MADYIYSAYEQTIWAKMLKFIGNEYGVAGAMGWMYGESALFPPRAENDFTSGWSASLVITSRIDKLGVNQHGEFSGWYNGRWIDDSIYDQYWRVNGKRYGGGYGLAQWTETRANSRKTRMAAYYVNRLKNGYRYSIGSAAFQMDWMEYEMRNWYAQCLKELQNATSVQGGMYSFGYWYEGWGSQTGNVVSQRINYGINLYNHYSGKTPVDPPEPKPPIPPDPTPQPPSPDVPVDETRRMPLWMLIDYSR